MNTLCLRLEILTDYVHYCTYASLIRSLFVVFIWSTIARVFIKSYFHFDSGRPIIITKLFTLKKKLRNQEGTNTNFVQHVQGHPILWYMYVFVCNLRLIDWTVHVHVHVQYHSASEQLM